MSSEDWSASFDRMVERIQQEISEQERAIYSAKAIEESHHPSHIGRMLEPDAYGRVESWCGDAMEFYLRLADERIAEVRFMTSGCGPTIACGNTLARLVEGKMLSEANMVLPEEVIEALDGLPEESHHCAELAVMTLQNAIFSWRFEHENKGGQIGDQA